MPKVDKKKNVWEWLAAVAILPIGIWVICVMAPLILLTIATVLPYEFIRGIYLRSRFESVYGKQGKRIVLVYSDSPHWQTYIEENWLPKLADVAIVLNWSQRSQWRRQPALESKVFHHWSGDREFNPMAIYLPRRGRVQTVRFWRAFRDKKHDHPEALEKLEAELFALADTVRREKPTL